MLDDNCNYLTIEATIMDQGQNALAAAAAFTKAFTVLSAPLPITGFTQLIMHTDNSTAVIYTCLGSIAVAASHITSTASNQI